MSDKLPPAKIQDSIKPKKKPRGRPFEPGVSGNYAGRPKGSRNRTTIWRERLQEGDAEAATQAVVDAARMGDMAAARVILQPLLPRPRDRAFEYELPPLRTIQEVADAMGQIIADIAEGELTIAEGEKLTRILERQVLILRAQETRQ